MQCISIFHDLTLISQITNQEERGYIVCLVTLSAAAVSASQLQIHAEIKTPLSLAETREAIVELRLQSNSNFQ